jgi:hypothetical protein
MDAILGPLTSRKKVDLRLPIDLTQHFSELAKTMGVPVNALYAIAAAQYLVELSSLQPRTKRESLLDAMETMFQNALTIARR